MSGLQVQEIKDLIPARLLSAHFCRQRSVHSENARVHLYGATHIITMNYVNGQRMHQRSRNQSANSLHITEFTVYTDL